MRNTHLLETNPDFSEKKYVGTKKQIHTYTTMEEEEGGGLTVLRRLVEEDIQKQMGRPIHNRHLCSAVNEVR
jgi:hypothetical protein